MKTNYIRIRVSELDKEMIKKNSEKKQMSMSEYLIYLARLDNEKNK